LCPLSDCKGREETFTQDIETDPLIAELKRRIKSMNMVNTVLGPVKPEDLGITLMHEHILYGYPGWEGDQSIAPLDRELIVNNAVTILTL
jgi:hypothetical protein